MSWTPFDESLKSPWDDFVGAHPDGRMVHLSGFKRVIEEVYGFKPFYRAYIEGGVVKAVFPGFFHKSRVYGRKILSQPFSEYGGILLAAGLAPADRGLILDGFCRMADRALRLARFRHLEMRNPVSLGGESADYFVRLPLFKYAVRRLDPPEEMWKSLDSKDRNIIQKARDYGLGFAEEGTEHSLRTKFYPLYLETMRRLGTPPHPLGYFRRLLVHLGGRMKVFSVSFRRVPVAALVAWAVGKTVHVTDMCSDAAAFFLKPNDLAVWEFLCWAYDRGFEIFDFGPVRYRGQEVFKKKWKMDLRPYSYVYRSLTPDAIKNPFSGAGGIMALAPRIWSGVMPLALGRLVGKFFRREVGL